MFAPSAVPKVPLFKSGAKGIVVGAIVAIKTAAMSRGQRDAIWSRLALSLTIPRQSLPPPSLSPRRPLPLKSLVRVGKSVA